MDGRRDECRCHPWSRCRGQRRGEARLGHLGRSRDVRCWSPDDCRRSCGRPSHRSSCVCTSERVEKPHAGRLAGHGVLLVARLRPMGRERVRTPHNATASRRTSPTALDFDRSSASAQKACAGAAVSGGVSLVRGALGASLTTRSSISGISCSPTRLDRDSGRSSLRDLLGPVDGVVGHLLPTALPNDA